MIKLKLAKPPYTRESLRMGALLIGRRAEVFLEEERSHFLVELKPAARLARAKRTALAGEFLNEVLTSLYRQELIRFAPELAEAILAQVLDKGFLAAPPDPLEQLEPQVRLDREAETEELLRSARERCP